MAGINIGGSLDFLKTCTTNVRVVENIEQMVYNIYQSSTTHPSSIDSGLSEAIAELRGEHVLCTGMKDERLYIFVRPSESAPDPSENTHERVVDRIRKEHDLNLVDEGVVDAETKGILLDAIESSLTYSLHSQQQILRIGSWTWLFASNESGSENESVIVKVQPRFTDDHLYFSTTTRLTSLRHLDNLDQVLGGTSQHPNIHNEGGAVRRDYAASDDHERHRRTDGNRCVFLAPSGRKAEIRKDVATGTAFSNDEWKNGVVMALRCDGFNISVDDYWILVGAESGRNVLWPAQLCLTTAKADDFCDIFPDNESKTERWKRYFQASTDDSTTEIARFRDPLAEAEEWFRASTTTHEELQSPVVAPDTAPSIVPETPLATSPPFNQRQADAHAAMAGIYPTPPDGYMPPGPAHHSTHATASTEAQDQQVEHSDEARPTSSDDQARPHSYDGLGSGEHDDLFGDMMDTGGFDEAADGEVGDADFSFFDEPPDDVPEEGAAPGPSGEVVEMEIEEPVVEEIAEDIASQQQPYETSLEDANEVVLEQDKPVADDKKQNLPNEDLAPLEEINDSAPPQKPALSPFGIRERLLPPPIPASATVQDDPRQKWIARRSSTYDPVSFNDGLPDLAAKYCSANNQVVVATEKRGPNIYLPTKSNGNPKKRPLKQSTDSEMSSTRSSSDDETDDTSISSSHRDQDDAEMPPRLPWDTATSRKRKRSVQQRRASEMFGDDRANDMLVDSTDGGQEIDKVIFDLCGSSAPSKDVVSSSGVTARSGDDPTLPSLTELLGLSKQDLIYTAQIVAEQSCSCIPNILAHHHTTQWPHQSPAAASAIELLMQETLATTLQTCTLEIKECSITDLAMARETPVRGPSQSHGKAPQHGHNRAVPPALPSVNVPDIFHLPAPYVRIQRPASQSTAVFMQPDNSALWEMLPPALNFWNALGLGPVSGSKDVRWIGVVPSSDDSGGELPAMVHAFVEELGSVYENCRLGDFDGMKKDGRYYVIEDAMDGFSRATGAVLVGLDDSESLSMSAILQAYNVACTSLGAALVDIGQQDRDRTIVVFVIDPFETEKSRQYLSACFWQLCKKYRESQKSNQRRGDLVPQIIPISLISSDTDGLVMLNTQQLGTLAREVYERCPPSAKSALAGTGSAPAIVLAPPPVRHLKFQLVADPPKDVLHENYVLHLAYSISSDNEWLCASWVDATGHYQSTYSACLRGKSLKDVLEDIWERTTETLESLAGGVAVWKLFVVVPQSMNQDLQKCWRALASLASKPRKQALQFTLLSVDTDPDLQLAEAAGAAGNTGAPTTPHGSGTAGFLTPASTPQQQQVSPDTSNVPPTPAPVVENTAAEDPDAHLIDVADESWGMLSTSSLSASTGDQSTAVASGLLLRRGPNKVGKVLGLGVAVHSEFRVRPISPTNQASSLAAVDEVPRKQTEQTLRETMKAYRGLGVLARARDGNLGGEASEMGTERDGEMLPVHISSAKRGAEALDGLLR